MDGVAAMLGTATSVVDPDSLNLDPDPDPAFQVNPDPFRIQSFDDKKFKKKKIPTVQNFI
jgi:hypothetical protein